MIGLLGLGFLGRAIWARPELPEGSWAAGHGAPVAFDWAQRETWGNLPEAGDLILTIPPLIQDPQAEAERIAEWGRWMKQNRPQLKRLVYISSTGVYPNEPGDYGESSPVKPAALRGQLRLASEEALAPFFDLKIIRPAAIYGPGRGIAERIKRGKPIPSDSGPIYRIHVADLARLSLMALLVPEFPDLVLAADPCPSSSLEVAQWLLLQPGWGEYSLNLEKGYLARKGYGSHPMRHLRTEALDRMGYQFLYPSYQEGLTEETP